MEMCQSRGIPDDTAAATVLQVWGGNTYGGRDFSRPHIHVGAGPVSLLTQTPMLCSE